MDSTGITPVMNMGNDVGFGGGGMWIFALLILLLLGNGGGLFGNRDCAGRYATVEDLNNSTNFTRLENQVMNTTNLVEAKTDAISHGICDLGYKTQADFATINQQVMESRYLNEKAIADSNAAITAQITALSSKIDQNKIESLQAQVNELKTQNMFCGIPRINPYGYGVYPYQPCGCGCFGNGNF